MIKPTEAQIAKLPAWARSYMRDIERERAVAVRKLNEYCDSQTPSKIYHEEYVSTGETQGPSLKCHYIQSNKITVNHAGIVLDVYAHTDGEIRLQWGGEDRVIGSIAMVPNSFQSVLLIAKENMR